MTGPVPLRQKVGIGRVCPLASEGHHALVFLSGQGAREPHLIAEQPHGHSPHGNPYGLIPLA
ncbi:hypothetical protein GCM10023324_11370 [Streptomyces youssoufiensis]